MRRPFSLRLIGFATAAAAAAIDQAHKYVMLSVVDIGARPPIAATPFLDVTLSWNHGVSYSLFAAHDGAAKFALLAFQGAIIAGLCVWLWRASDKVTAIGLGLVIGGALGNAADRLVHGAVADFFYLHTSWPVGPLANYVFNLADVAITFGVGALLIDSLFGEKGAPPRKIDVPPTNRQEVGDSG